MKSKAPFDRHTQSFIFDRDKDKSSCLEISYGLIWYFKFKI